MSCRVNSVSKGTLSGKMDGSETCCTHGPGLQTPSRGFHPSVVKTKIVDRLGGSGVKKKPPQTLPHCLSVCVLRDQK